MIACKERPEMGWVSNFSVWSRQLQIVSFEYPGRWLAMRSDHMTCLSSCLPVSLHAHFEAEQWRRRMWNWALVVRSLAELEFHVADLDSWSQNRRIRRSRRRKTMEIKLFHKWSSVPVPVLPQGLRSFWWRNAAIIHVQEQNLLRKMDRYHDAPTIQQIWSMPLLGCWKIFSGSGATAPSYSPSSRVRCASHWCNYLPTPSHTFPPFWYDLRTCGGGQMYRKRQLVHCLHFKDRYSHIICTSLLVRSDSSESDTAKLKPNTKGGYCHHAVCSSG